jgi:hypothetical protein
LAPTGAFAPLWYFYTLYGVFTPYGAKTPVGANKHFMMQWHSMMPKSTARRMGLFMHMHFAVLISTNRCASTLWFKSTLWYKGTKITKPKNMRYNDFEGVNILQKLLHIWTPHMGVWVS